MDFKERLEERLELEVKQFYGLGNRLLPSLGFSITIRNPLPTRLSVISYIGNLAIQTAQGPELHLGEFKRYITSTPPYPICISANNNTQEHFLIEISWDSLEKIEKSRGGNEFIIKGDLTILFIETPATPNEGSTVKRMFWMNGQLLREQRSSMVIHKEEWLTALRAWGYADKRILEIDMPSLELFKKNHEKAYTHLQTAITKTWEGDYRHVLTECRLCLDNLEELFKTHITDLANDDGNEIRKQKIEKLQKAIREICDIGPHKGLSPTRAEALLCLSVTRELLAYLGQQRCAHKNVAVNNVE